MEITQDQKREIEKITREIDCPKDFECCKSSFENVGSIKDIGTQGLLECLEQNAHDCKFSLSFGSGSSCLCPLRIYIATEMHR